MKRPRLGPIGCSTPSMMSVRVPIGGATHGVAGNSNTGHSRNRRSTSALCHRRNACARKYHAAGISACARKRSRVSGSKSSGRLRSRSSCGPALSDAFTSTAAARASAASGKSIATAFGNASPRCPAPRRLRVDRLRAKIATCDADAKRARFARRRVADRHSPRQRRHRSRRRHRRPCASSGPIVEIDPGGGSRPSPGTAPRVGRNPYTPQSEAGKRTEPSASLPSAIGTRPPATAAADPPDDPPGVRRQIVRIAGRAEMAVLGRAAHAELVHVGDADADRAGPFEPGDGNGITLRGRIVDMQLRTRGRREARDGDLRLDRERNTRERTRRRAARNRGVETRAALACALGADGGERIEGVDRAMRCARARDRRRRARDYPPFADGARNRDASASAASGSCVRSGSRDRQAATETRTTPPPSRRDARGSRQRRACNARAASGRSPRRRFGVRAGSNAFMPSRAFARPRAPAHDIVDVHPGAAKDRLARLADAVAVLAAPRRWSKDRRAQSCGTAGSLRARRPRARHPASRTTTRSPAAIGCSATRRCPSRQAALRASSLRHPRGASRRAVHFPSPGSGGRGEGLTAPAPAG